MTEIVHILSYVPVVLFSGFVVFGLLASIILPFFQNSNEGIGRGGHSK